MTKVLVFLFLLVVGFGQLAVAKNSGDLYICISSPKQLSIPTIYKVVRGYHNCMYTLPDEYATVSVEKAGLNCTSLGRFYFQDLSCSVEDKIVTYAVYSEDPMVSNSVTIELGKNGNSIEVNRHAPNPNLELCPAKAHCNTTIMDCHHGDCFGSYMIWNPYK